jgi:hypothetical protein
MAKRLRDVCTLPESEPLWRAGRGFVVRDLPWTVEKLLVLRPLENSRLEMVATDKTPATAALRMGRRAIHRHQFCQ